MPRSRKKEIPQPRFKLSPETKRDILVILIFALAFLSLLAIFNLAGSFGQTIENFWQRLLGWGSWLAPFILLLIGYLIINAEKYELKMTRWLGLFLFILTFSGLLQLFIPAGQTSTFRLQSDTGGGIIGYLVSMPLEKIASFWGSLIILMALFLISLLLFFETSLAHIRGKFHWPEINFIIKFKQRIKERLERKKLEAYEAENIGFEQKEIAADTVKETEKTALELEGEKVDQRITQAEIFPAARKKYHKIDIPLDLLTGKVSQPSAGDIRANQETIKKTLGHFGIEVEMGEISVGPTVTQYTLKPASGIKLSQITSLANDLALALAAHPIRIEAPIPGKSLVGIEVPNQKVALVPLKEVLSSPEFKQRESNLMIALGKDVAGKPWLANLEKMPHLLVAGATGAGKTVSLNAIIISLLYENQPDDLKLILVDPKRVELPLYNGIPYLICPVITEVKKTVTALRWAVKEMERRFEILSQTGKRNIAGYNATYPQEKIPWLVLIIDELADLMAIAAVEVEGAIIRLSQMARATGIHLIVATQRPSVDVITGLIKANITSRIAFSVASIIDSRTILDYAGAEKLLGRGDMLFISPEISKPKRLQGAYVSDEEIERIVRYLKQKGEPDYDEEVTKLPPAWGIEKEGKEFAWSEGDELLPEAKDLVIKAGKASASYLQRRLRIGYARAARLLDLLEEQGIVGPVDGAKPREVLIKRPDQYNEEEKYGESMGRIEENEMTDEGEKGENDENASGNYDDFSKLNRK